MSKYDLFIVYDPEKDEILEALWDCSVNRVDWWLHRTNDSHVRFPSKKHISWMRQNFIILERIPEHIHRGEFCLR